MFSLGEGDTAPDLDIEIDDGANLTGATSINLEVTRPDGTEVILALTSVDLVNGLVKREWSAGDTDIPGVHSAIVRLVLGGDPQTFPADGSRLQWVVMPRSLAQ